MKIIEVASVLQRKTHYNQSGQALLPPLKLRQKGLVPASRHFRLADRLP